MIDKEKLAVNAYQLAEDALDLARKALEHGGGDPTATGYTKAESDARYYTKSASDTIFAKIERVDSIDEYLTDVTTTLNNLDANTVKKNSYGEYTQSSAGINWYNSSSFTVSNSGSTKGRVSLKVATDADIQTGASNTVPLTPASIPKFMREYGITEKNDITKLKNLYQDDMTLLEDGTDLNDIVEGGFYRTSNATSVGTMSNKPTNKFFFMLVLRGGSSNTTVTQILFDSSNTVGAPVYRRVKYAGTWRTWYKFEGTAVDSLPATQALTLNFDEELM